MPHNEVGKIQRGRAKQLRSTMTRAESLLWRHLKAHRLARLGFRRQSPMGNYIADFVSHSCKLVVEVDGESHDFESRVRYDRQRDEWFASRGYRVLRFTNEDVMKNLEGVVVAIGLAAEQAAPPSLTLPRRAGESHMEKTNVILRIAYGAWRMEVATVPASILLCSPFDSIVPHILHVATLGQAVDAAAEIPYAIALPRRGGGDASADGAE